MPGTFAGEAWWVAICRPQEYRKILPSMDGARDLWQTALRPGVSGIAVDVRLFHETVPRVQMLFGAYVSGLQGPVSPSGAPGGGGGVLP